MAIYSGYLPPEYMSDPVADRFQLVSDAKSPLALIFPPFWLAWHRLWLELLAYGVVVLAIGLLAAWKPSTAVLYLSALPGLYLLLEGNELIRGKLERNGWRFAGLVDADTKEAAEIRFLMQNEKTFDAPNTPTVLTASRQTFISDHARPVSGLVA